MEKQMCNSQKLVNLRKRYESVQIYKLKKSIVKRVMDRHIDQRLLNIFCKGPESKSVNILGFEGHTIPVTTTQCSLLPL